MKYTRLKLRVLLVIILIGVFSIIGCSQDNKEQSEITLGEKVEKLLKYKGSNIGDNSAVGNISNYLLTSDNLQGFELKTGEEPMKLH
ncbi:DUF4825 domain-containing protein [Paraclostridium bifermentans]|nr:DUF4825 domain-containing protein [Paraclostridium bifermentans]